MLSGQIQKCIDQFLHDNPHLDDEIESDFDLRLKVGCEAILSSALNFREAFSGMKAGHKV